MKARYARKLHLFVILFLLAQALGRGASAETVPVIFDTDIGDDIDDTWALAMILKSPELNLKLVTTTCGKADYRGKLVARILEIGQRTDVPIGLGAGGRAGEGGQQAWVQDYQLEKYPGKVYADGVQALIDMVNGSTQSITIISVGPSHTVAAALERHPEIASKAYFVGMQGSVRKGYDGGAIAAEYNVKANVPAAQKALLASWKRTTITPLDTCGEVKLSGRRYERVAQSKDPLAQAVVENYRIWAKKSSLTQSSVLFDTVAVYLAYPGSKPLLKLEPLTINVDAEGFTRLDSKGMPMAVATGWESLDKYEDWMVDLLLRPTPSKVGNN